LLFFAVVLLTGVGQGQDKAESPRVKGWIPANWGKFGLSDQQKQQIYKIQGEFHERIAPLEKQLKELHTKKKENLEAILTDEQKKKLKEINSAPLPDQPKKP
jgi:hypothetical protein